MKQAFYPLQKQNIARAWQQEITFIQTFRSVPVCQTCMCKRGISQNTYNIILVKQSISQKCIVII